MIEIINIIYLTIGLTLIFLSPTQLVYKFTKNNNLNFFEIYSINIVFILNIFLLFSFFSFNLNYIFFLFTIIGVINFFYIHKNFKFKNDYLFLTFLLFVFLYSIKIASNLRLEWDAAVLWIYRTLNFYEGFNFWNLKNVHDGSLAYPHLGTYGWALIWKNSLIDFEYTGRIFYIFTYLVSIFLIISKYNFSFRFNLIIAFIATSMTFDLGLFSGYQEPLMFALVIFLFVLIYKANNFNHLNILHWICIINANLILWVRNEGVAFIIYILLILLIEKKIKKQIKLFFLLSFSTIILIKFLIFNFYFTENLIGWKGYQFINFDQFFSYEILQRFLLLIFQLNIIFFKYPIYIIFILFLLYQILIKNFKHDDFKYLIFFILNCLMSFSIYYFVDDQRWHFHSSVTMDRILYQSSGIYLIFILNFCQKYFFKSKINYNNL